MKFHFPNKRGKNVECHLCVTFNGKERECGWQGKRTSSYGTKILFNFKKQTAKLRLQALIPRSGSRRMARVLLVVSETAMT